MSTNMADRVKRLFEAGQLSGHSVKFYDGTYKWDSEGFENEHGVYQKFGVEPERRPPTPLLPLALSDCGDELADDYKASPTAFQEANTGTGIHQLPHNGYIGLRGGADIASPAIQGAYQNTLPLQLRSALLVVKQGAAEVNGFVHEKALPRRDLFQDRDNLTRQRLYGRLEGMLIGAHLARNVSLKEAYSLVNVQYPDDIVELLAWDEKVRANRAAGPSYDQSARFAGEPAKSPFSNISGMTDVSDPPSDLECEEELKLEGTKRAGERAKSPFSDISGMTDVSDPPSDLELEEELQLDKLTLKEVKGLKPHSKTDEYHARNNEQQKLSEGILKNVGQETVGGRRKAGYSSLNERTPPNSDEDFDHPKKGLRKVGVDHDTKTIKQESGDADEHMENAQVGAPGSHSQNPQKGENGTKASKYTRARGTKNKNDSVKNRAKDNHQDLDTIEKMDIDMAEFPTKKQKTGSDTAHAKGAAPEAATKTAGRAGSKAKKGIARPKTAPKVAKTAGSKAAKSGKDNNATMSAPPTRRSTRLARD